MENSWQLKWFSRFAWFNLFYCIFVILLGAWVRATGSGAGCGDHWPLCNGQVVPLDPSTKTSIEYTHRLTSGFCLVFIAALYFFSVRLFRKGSFQRKASLFSLVAVIIEALIGAIIVLLRLVEHDQSYDRAISIALHLVNTLFLVAAVSLVSFSAKKTECSFSIKHTGARILVIGFALLGALGALTALGDTLFPVTSLSAELAEKFSYRRHFLQDIRIFHPLLAVAWAGYLWIWLADAWKRSSILRFPSYCLLAVVLGQLIFGILNVLLLAPIWAQLVHLAWANAIWAGVIWIIFSLSVSGKARRAR